MPVADRNRRNFYRILHVQPDAPAAVIKSSYRALMLSLEMHPDYGGEHWNAVLINEAYAVLCDPDRRQAYDAIDLRFRSAARPLDDDPTPTRCVFCGASLVQGRDLPPGVSCSRCQSPLELPADLQASGLDPRRAGRTVRGGLLRYFVGWPQEPGFGGALQDLSPTGLRFLGAAEVSEHQILKIDAEPLSATARVVYCRPAARGSEFPFTVGADFFTLRFNRTSGTFVSTRA